MPYIPPSRKIAKDLKTELGLNSRQVSCRMPAGGETVFVTLKVSGLNVAAIREIAGRQRNIRRDHMSNEILAGGNTYVQVRWDDALIEEIAAMLPKGAGKHGRIEMTEHEDGCGMVVWNLTDSIDTEVDALYDQDIGWKAYLFENLSRLVAKAILALGPEFFGLNADCSVAAPKSAVAGQIERLEERLGVTLTLATPTESFVGRTFAVPGASPVTVTHQLVTATRPPVVVITGEDYDEPQVVPIGAVATWTEIFPAEAEAAERIAAAASPEEVEGILQGTKTTPGIYLREVGALSRDQVLRLEELARVRRDELEAAESIWSRSRTWMPQPPSGAVHLRSWDMACADVTTAVTALNGRVTTNDFTTAT